MAGRYTGSYLDQSCGWRAVAILAGTGRASLVERIPKGQCRREPEVRQLSAFLVIASQRSTQKGINGLNLWALKCTCGPSNVRHYAD